MVIVKNIELYSMWQCITCCNLSSNVCAIFAQGKVIGLSKSLASSIFLRVVADSRNLTKKIAETIVSKREATGAAVIIAAQLCAMMDRVALKKQKLCHDQPRACWGPFPHSQKYSQRVLNRLIKSK